MKILIDIAHPAHIHYFRNLSSLLKEKGHVCIFTLRDKGPIVELASYYNLTYHIRSKPEKHPFKKFKYLFSSFYNLFKIALKEKPDLYLDMGTVIAAPIAKFFRKPYIAFEDTEAGGKARLFFMPFTNIIFTPSWFCLNLGRKQFRFNAFMEQMYLHPPFYQINKDIRLGLNIKPNEKYALVRFVSWEAFHDKGRDKLNYSDKIRIIERLEKYSKVLISSESQLPEELLKYQIKIHPYQMHDVIANAAILISEGATMATEAVILNTPVIYCNSIMSGNSIKQEAEGFLKASLNVNEILETIDRIFSTKEVKTKSAFNKMYLDDSINATEFITWFVDNYPESKTIIRDNVDYQFNFKP